MTTPTGPNDTQSMALTPRQQRLVETRDAMAPGERPGAIVPRNFAEVEVMCKALATAGLVPTQYRDRPTDMMFTVMSGAELGLPPMASLRLYHNIEGKLSLGAEGIRGVILSHPSCEYLEFVESSPARAVWIGKKRGRPEKSITWTIERAKQAGLAGKPNWTKSPEDMLNARASMQLGRLNWPDIMAGIVSREELMDGAIDAEFTEKRPEFVQVPATIQVTSSGGPQVADVIRQAQAKVEQAASVIASVVQGAPADPPKQRRARAEKAETAPRPTTAEAAKVFETTVTTKASDHAQTAAAVVIDADTGEVVKDRWGQAVAKVEAKASPTTDSATTPSTESASTSPTTETSSSAAGLASFEDEDPVDTQPAGPVRNDETFKAWLAAQTSGSEMAIKAQDWIAWVNSLGDQKVKFELRPEGMLRRKWYLDRKAELPG